MLVALLNNPHSDFWIDLDVFDFGVVPNVILPVLDTMGLFELTFLPPKSDYAKKNPSLHRHIEKFKINDFAKIIWLNYVEFFRLNYPPLKGWDSWFIDNSIRRDMSNIIFPSLTSHSLYSSLYHYS